MLHMLCYLMLPYTNFIGNVHMFDPLINSQCRVSNNTLCLTSSSQTKKDLSQWDQNSWYTILILITLDDLNSLKTISKLMSMIPALWPWHMESSLHSWDNLCTLSLTCRVSMNLPALSRHPLYSQQSPCTLKSKGWRKNRVVQSLWWWVECMYIHQNLPIWCVL